MNISSIIVRAKRDDWENLLEEIGKVAYSEVALEDRDKGVIIATIEAPDTGADIQSLKQISALRGVLSADMHLSYMQDLEECRLDINEIAELIDTDLTGSLHRALREVFHREPARGHKTFEVCFATQNEAFLLDVPKATPLMLVTDYVCDADGAPLYASKRAMRTDRAKYREPIG